MKLTTKQLKQIIQEEISTILDEGEEASDWHTKMEKSYIHPVIKYKLRRQERAKNHPDPKIRELAKVDIKQAMELVDMIDGDLKPLDGEQKEFARENKQ